MNVIAGGATVRARFLRVARPAAARLRAHAVRPHAARGWRAAAAAGHRRALAQDGEVPRQELRRRQADPPEQQLRCRA